MQCSGTRSASPLLAAALAFLVLLVAMVSLPVPARGDAPAPAPLIVSQDDNWPPFSFSDSNGEAQGLLIDLWREIGRQLERPVEFRLTDWGGSLDQVRNGSAQIHGGLIDTPTRREFLDFSVPFMELSAAVFVPSDLMVPSLAGMKPWTLGVITDSFEQAFMAENHPDQPVRLFRSNNNMVKAAANGEVIGFVADYPVGMYLLDRHTQQADFRPLAVLYTRDLHAAVAKGDEDLLAAVNGSIAAMGGDSLRRLSQPWISSQRVTVAPWWVWPLVLLSTLLVGLLVLSLGLNRQRRILRRRIHQRNAELKQTRNQLQDTVKTLQQVTTNMPGVVFSFTKDEADNLCFPYISSRIEDLFGISPDTLGKDGAPLLQRLHPEDKESYLEGIKRAVEIKGDWYHQGRFLTVDGSYRWFEAESRPQRTANKQVIWYGYFTDIQRQKETDAALQASESKFRALVESANDSIYTLTSAGVFTYVSLNWERELGHPAAKVIGQHFSQFIHPEDLAACEAFVQRVLTTGERHGGIEYRVQHQNGHWRWHTSNASVVLDEASGEQHFMGISRDITEHRLSQDEILYQSQFQKMISRLSSGFARMGTRDIDRMINQGLGQAGQFFNVGRCYLYRFTQNGAAMSNTHEWCAHGITPLLEDQQEVLLANLPWSQAQMKKLITDNEVLHIEDVSKMPPSAAQDQALLTDQGVKSLFCVPMHVEGQVAGFLGVDAMEPRNWREDQADLLIVLANLFSEAQGKHRLEQDLIRLAATDPLTGLYNRRHLMQRMEAMGSDYARGQTPYSIIILDLDHFKVINDSHGHLAGDFVLQQVAQILQQNIRPSDVAVRYGGEEFLLLLSATENPQALQLAERLLGFIRNTPMTFNGLDLEITASSGLACVSEVTDHKDLDQLILLADQRLYRAKARGRNRIEHQEG
ncbi:MAG: diguanylate cyclase [Halomonadaceae bacterium]|nr:MAG: diguanylate cyclase [Halomonadaceae bacterium]